MLAQIRSLALSGLTAHPVIVEVSISAGLPAMHIGGLADTAILEARERVRAAIKESGMSFPMSRITCNLTPAHIRKEGSHFDLSIALGILIAQGLIPPLPPDVLCVGELSLSGTILPVRGLLSMAIAAAQSRAILLCPKQQMDEISIFSGFRIVPCESLSEVASLIASHTLQNHQTLTTTHSALLEHPPPQTLLEDIHGMEFAKAALIVAVAGRHHVLFHGPPGIGKTLLGHAARGIQVPLASNERLEVAALWSSRGIRDSSVMPPFRSPHHSASATALIGGGNPIRPGEMSLAHRGILFLDEFAEFDRDVIEALRQPMQEGTVDISRSSGSETYPARSTVVAAMNPCRCGYYGSAERTCTCQPSSLRAYHRRISGPIIDRFDMVIDLNNPPRLPKYWDKRFSPWTTEHGRALVQGARDVVLDPDEFRIDEGTQKLVDRFLERGWVTRRSAKSLFSMARTLAQMFALQELDEDVLRMAFLFKSGVSEMSRG